MSMLVWVMMGIAVWHFTVFVPDRFWGGIVGAFLAASIVRGAVRPARQRGQHPRSERHGHLPGADRDTRLGDRAGALVLVRLTRRPPARHRPRPDARRLALSWLAPAPVGARSGPHSVRPSSQDGPDAPPSRARWACDPYDVTAAERLAAGLGVSQPVGAILARRGFASVEEARRFLAADERHDPLTLPGVPAACELDRRAPARAARASRSSATTTSTASAPPRSWSAPCARSAATRSGSCPAASTRATASRRPPSSASPQRGVRPAGHRRLRHHGRRAGRRRARRGPRRGGHRPPSAGRRSCPTAWSYTRRCRRPTPYAPSCAPPASCSSSARPSTAPRAATRRRPRSTSTWPRSRRSATSSRCAARTAASCARAWSRCPHPETRPAGADVGRRGRAGRADRAIARLPARAAHQRRRPHAARRRGARAAADRGRRPRGGGRAASSTCSTRDRRQAETRILFAAEAACAPQAAQGAIVVAGEGWHPGVVGIVASRLVERWRRPCVVIALEDDGSGRGSGRSVSAYDLHEGLAACAEHLTRFGGHRMAAGVELARGRRRALPRRARRARRAPRWRRRT